MGKSSRHQGAEWDLLSTRYVRILCSTLYLSRHLQTLLTPHSGHFSPFISCSCKLTAPWLVHGTRQCGLIGPIPQLFPVCPGASALSLKLVLFSRASSCPSFGELWSYFCAVHSRDICQASLGTTLPSTEGDSLEPHLATVGLSRVPCLEQSGSIRFLP